MPRAEVGTPKYLANAMKSKGLQRLRWYCQVCQKQCRDENGFKCHTTSEAHLRQMLVVGEHAGRHIADFSGQFQGEFVALLSRRYSTNRVKANNVYQEYIQDKHHVHMNSTRWVTLSAFVQHLGRCGIAHVDDTEKGWFLAWIDNSPKALAKADATMKKERMKMSDEQRERVLLAEQLERAKEIEAGGGGGSGSGEEGSGSATPPAEELALKREDGAEKVVLGFSMKAPAPAADAPTAPVKLAALKSANPLKASNPLKRPNPLKAAGATPALEPEDPTAKKRDREPTSVAERLMIEDQQRKRRRMEREGGR